MSVKLSFHGANQTVTGSCHLLECNGVRILVDCGLYQGEYDEYKRNSEDFGFDPVSIDVLLLTHAHLDHCGRIPLLVQKGFCGEIITTAASRELAKLIMLDSAGLQEEEARYRTRRARRRNGQGKEYVPLYTVVDALASMDYFGRNAEYEKPIRIADGVDATFFDAGHILGSASIAVDVNQSGARRRVVFSGDIGSGGHPILREPQAIPDSDVVVMETTYGDRPHKQLEPSIDEFYEAINATMERGGNVIIPTFALERAQELLFYLREGIERKMLPVNLSVFLDSPMAISATKIFRRHPTFFNAELLEMMSGGNDPFQFRGLHFCRDTAESMALNRVGGGAVILAGSGMCTGGRVVHHLKHNLWNENNSVVFVGFAAEGTLARRIIDGDEMVKVYGDEIRVRAQVHTINGFSAHADCNELLNWHKTTGSPARTFLVHGEPKAMGKFAERLSHTKVEIPALHSEYLIPFTSGEK